MDETPPAAHILLPSRLSPLPFSGDAARPEHKKVLIEQNDQAKPGYVPSAQPGIDVPEIVGKDYSLNSNMQLECAVLAD